MSDKKIFVFLPDGVGLRNFAYSDFYKLGRNRGFDIVYWNSTDFPLKDMGFKEIPMDHSKIHPLTYIYKNARKHIELKLSAKKTRDKIYDTYHFGFSYKDWRSMLKSLAAKFLIATHTSKNGLRRIINRVNRFEKSTAHYQQSYEILKREKPDLLFLTNQRQVNAVATLLAAKDLGIPTATFIFSWDNLPKATMTVEADYYIVWSGLMKSQLLFYYPEIREEQVFITGTPQFEPHTEKERILPREMFFSEYGLDPARKYICFSGDDMTTSPNDQQYLADTAEAIQKLNTKGGNFGLIFRRSPADFSNRYDEAIKKYADVIAVINPKWKEIGQTWNTILPSVEDLNLQMNTIAHTEMVINVGSSMVFDYVALGKPCAYINYDVEHSVQKGYTVQSIYNFVHFRSMPSKEAVVWLNDPKKIADDITEALSGKTNVIEQAQRWFEIINLHPIDNASVRIHDAFEKIMTKSTIT
jgi:hypothetical protein